MLKHFTGILDPVPTKSSCPPKRCINYATLKPPLFYQVTILKMLMGESKNGCFGASFYLYFWCQTSSVGRRGPDPADFLDLGHQWNF